jgi:hypothetical protein
VVKETVTAAELMDRLRFFEAQAEEAYRRMYNAKPGSELAARYSDTKEAFHEAIIFARRLKLTRETTRLEKRLAEIKTIFRSQFPAQ